MNDFVKWLNRAMYMFILLLLVVVVVINNREELPNKNAMLIADIFQWALLFGMAAVAGLKAYVQYKNDPEGALPELRVMAMIICGVVGVAVCILCSLNPDSTTNIWQQWLFWTCLITAIVGGALWLVIRRRKNG